MSRELSFTGRSDMNEEPPLDRTNPMKHLLLCAAALGFISFLSGPTFAVSYTATPQESESKSSLDASDQKNEEEERKSTEGLTFEEKMKEFNSTKAFLTESRKLFAGQVSDNEDRAIGEIKDIIIAEGGEVLGVMAVLGRLSMGNAYLNAQDMKLEGAQKGYKIGFSGDDVKKIFIEMPNKPPQSPEGKILSAKALYKQDVITLKGDSFGEIVDILFSEDAMRVEAVLTEVNFGPVRKTLVAVPVEALSFSQKRTKPIFTIDSKMAAKVMDFAIAQKK